MSRLITADKIHDGFQFIQQPQVIELDDDGSIINIRARQKNDDVIFYEGIICPGWVNAHCHLELSHLKGKIAKAKGLLYFLQQVMQLRNQFTAEEIVQAIAQQVQQMTDKGIVAVGDIANTLDTAAVVANKNLAIHTFIEAMGFDEQLAERSWERVLNTQQLWQAQLPTHPTSVVAHAPYSVSAKLFKHIAQAAQTQIPQTIHNQEWQAENSLYQSKTGEAMTLLQSLHINTDLFTPTQKNSLPSIIHYYKKEQQLLLVHNTRSNQEDIQTAIAHSKNIWWCLCPKANLYIENRLPDIELLHSLTHQICIGTDSLASNDQLDIAAELNTIKQNFPSISWEKLIKWGTLNGAQALQMQHQLGSIQAGKKCGLLHVTVNDDVLHLQQRIA